MLVKHITKLRREFGRTHKLSVDVWEAYSEISSEYRKFAFNKRWEHELSSAGSLNGIHKMFHANTDGKRKEILREKSKLYNMLNNIISSEAFGKKKNNKLFFKVKPKWFQRWERMLQIETQLVSCSLFPNWVNKIHCV